MTKDPFFTVYVIRCATPHHYYVGMTGHYDDRIEAHRSGEGAAWVKKHGFDCVVEFMQVRTISEAKALETETYYRYKRSGFEVRGAGNTPS